MPQLPGDVVGVGSGPDEEVGIAEVGDVPAQDLLSPHQGSANRVFTSHDCSCEGGAGDVRAAYPVPSPGLLPLDTQVPEWIQS